MTRTTKTPAVRAKEALDVADRLVDRLGQKRETLELDLHQARADHEVAIKRRDYLAQSPDLEQPAVAGSAGVAG